jgi:hypothetical protein
VGSFRLCVPLAALAAILCLLFLANPAQAQNGGITGTIKDNQGAVIPGAHVTLTDQDRAGQRKMDSGAEGMFLFDSLTPSNYTLVIEAPGFKKWEKKDIKLYASDRIGISDIVLEVGQLTETITVEATAAQLQTETAKVEGTVTSQQVTEIPSYNRNFMNLLRMVPGVTGLSTSSAGGQVNINGQRNDQISFKLDGMLNMDMGNNSCCSSLPNMDMIAEMKVVTNGGTADMGTVGSSQILVVTKSGGREFHGNAYYFRRHESMNANSWTNNITGSPRGRDRQNQAGLTLGGPIFIPKVFNTKKEKLYFFVSEELWRNLSPNTTRATVPTALERVGDFSKSVRANDNTAAVVLDPTNNRSPFPGGIVPKSMFNADAVKLMNLMPLPGGVTDPAAYQYNFQRSNTSNYNDYLNQAYKVDYNISERWRVYMRYSHDYNEAGSPTAMGFEQDSAGKDMGWNLDWRTAWNSVLNVTTILSPTTTNEVILGGSRNSSHYWINNAAYTRKNLGLNYQNPYPSAVIGDYGPRVTFSGSGLSNYPSLGSTRPYHADNPDYQLTDNFSKVLTRHTIKIGGVYQIDRKDQDPWGGTTYPGAFTFGRDAQNPVDTDVQYANLLTGGYQTFQQVPKMTIGRYVFHQGEWWAMDTWKVRPNLTLDLGMRFSVFQPTYDAFGQQATFSKDLWDPKQAVKLYGYAPGGKAVDPTTGKIYPSFMRGQIVVGSGNINNGFTLVGQNNTPSHLMPYAGIQYAPRIGIAWQPGFLPKTVIRVGAGLFKDRIQGNVGMDAQNSPPTTRSSTLQYGNMADINSSLYTLVAPPSLSQSGYAGSGKIPKTLNWNFSIQRELPNATMLTVSYVGSISRHLIYLNMMNEPNFGAAWAPWTQDPTVTPKYDGTTTLPVNYYRPYAGISTMNLYSSGSSTNYNALQVQLEKRMSRKLSYGVAYTWAKAMGIGDQQWSWTNTFDRRKYNYGRLAYDRAHVMTANFVYHLPKVGKNGNFLDHPGIRLALNDWEVAGLVTAQTGTPNSFGFGFSGGVSNQNRQWTGQETYGPRPIIGDWRMPADKMNDYQQFNVAAIQPAKIPSVGLESGPSGYWSSPITFLSSPEISFNKNVVFSQDGKRYVQLRVETFNLLNHHDYTGRNMGATFKSPTDLTLTNLPTAIATQLAGGVPTTAGGRFGFGALNGAASPRRLQVSFKIYF